MKHSFVSSVPEVSDPTIVGSREWNEPHVTGVRTLSTDDAIDSSDDFIEATGGVAGITVTLPPCAGLAGHRFEVMKVDSGAGSVLLDGTVNGDAGGYYLVNQFQIVVLQVKADESGYLVVRAN